MISTFSIYLEGRTHVVIHRCLVVGQLLSAILVSKGAKCDVIDSEVTGSSEDGVFFVSASGSVRGCRIHQCGMNAVEIHGTTGDIVVENNVMYKNGSGLYVPYKQAAAQIGQAVWRGKVMFDGNQVIDSSGASLRVETCSSNPYVVMGRNVLSGNADQLPLASKLQDALDRGVCTREATGAEHEYQPWFECITCGLDAEHREQGVCSTCVVKCHAGHETIQRWTHTKSFCDCGCSINNDNNAPAALVNPPPQPIAHGQ